MGKERTFKGEILPEFMDVYRSEQPQRAFWIQAEIWHLAKLSVVVEASMGCPCWRRDLSASVQCQSASDLCQCSAFAQLLMSTSSSAPAAAPPLAPIHSAFQQPPATEPHVTHPAQTPLSPGEKGSILTLWCHCCGRWPPPPTSMPAHHTQIQEHQHHNNYFPAQKKGKFCLIIQRS